MAAFVERAAINVSDDILNKKGKACFVSRKT